MVAVWEMNLMEGKNPAHTASFLNAYDNRNFTPSQVLARESGQNSMDAGRKCPGITEMEFHWLRASGEGKKDILSLLELDEPLKGRLAAYEEGSRFPTFCSAVRDLFTKDDVEFLLIRDFKTCGLGGKWNRFKEIDHFMRLVCALNLDDKSDNDPHSGGSFGLGKTTYSNSSLVNTVLYHSMFEETEDTDGANRRLMVAGVYPRHTFKGAEYGGFAYWGEEVEPGSGEARPYENEEALENWKLVLGACGRDDLLRNDDQHGTDILIFQPSVTISQLKQAVEDFYWPAIIEQKLSVKFYEAKDEPQFPKPVDREDLKPFINLFNRVRVNGGALIDTDTCVIAELHRVRGHKAGSIAIEPADDLGDDDEKLNSVALMRGTGMVINYKKVGKDAFEPVRGIFVADSEIYDFLLISENMAHSEWDPESRRLNQLFPDDGRAIVRSVHSRIKKRFETFQKNLQPMAPKRSDEHGFFSRLMSKAFIGKGRKIIEDGEPNPVAVSLVEKTRDADRMIWHLVLTDNEHTPDGQTELTLKPQISISGDAKRIAVKRRAITFKKSDGTIIHKGHNPVVEVPFQKGTVFDGTMELDAPGDYNYIAGVDISVSLLFDKRKLGLHPDNGKEIVAGISREGPCLFHDGAFTVLPTDDDVESIGLNRAIALLADETWQETRETQ
jgi:ribosomal protein L34